jgi:3-hydroxyacyl-[acyl-carrier-protein] dehydratase
MVKRRQNTMQFEFIDGDRERQPKLSKSPCIARPGRLGFLQVKGTVLSNLEKIYYHVCRQWGPSNHCMNESLRRTISGLSRHSLNLMSLLSSGGLSGHALKYASSNIDWNRTLKNSFVDFSEIDFNRILVSRDEIMKINPHRFEMALLDGILYQTETEIVGFKDVASDEFWVRGHFPGRPLMPGVLMCECAAQLSSYFALTNNMVTQGNIGLGGLDKIRFRGPVVPGNKLVIMMKRNRARQNVIFNSEFQGYIDENLVVDGMIIGVVLK